MAWAAGEGDRSLELESWSQVLESLIIQTPEDHATVIRESTLFQLLQSYWGDLDEAAQSRFQSELQPGLARLAIAQVHELMSLILHWQSFDEFEAWLASALAAQE